jgi:hypothetical protein
MSPRVVPASKRGALPPDVEAVMEAQRAENARRKKLAEFEPYVPGGPYSFFRDLWRLRKQDERIASSFRGQDPGEIPLPIDHNDPIANVHERLSRYWRPERRDLSSSNAAEALKPSAPGWIAQVYGQANRQVGRLANAIEQRRIDRGMIDNSSGTPVLVIPRLSGGAGVAIQASQNAAVQETDPTTTSYSAPIGSVAGQVDMSAQLFEFSRPGLDEAISDDLGRASGVTIDSQLIAGSGASGQLRGLVNVSGILTLATTATTVQAQLSAIWNGFNVLAGTTGFGNPDPSGYLTILHPRRFAWLSGGSGGTGVQTTPNLPGQVVLTGGVRTNLGAGTNEDEVLIVEKSNLILAGGDVRFRVYPEVGSGTLTVRVQSQADAALVVKNPAAILRISGFPNPTF